MFRRNRRLVLSKLIAEILGRQQGVSNPTRGGRARDLSCEGAAGRFNMVYLENYANLSQLGNVKVCGGFRRCAAPGIPPPGFFKFCHPCNQ